MNTSRALLFALLLAASGALAAKTPLPVKTPDESSPPGPARPPARPDTGDAAGNPGTGARLWHTDIETALTAAAVDYRPVLVLFSRPDCGWCHRLKSEIHSTPDTMALIKHYVLVEVDASKDEATAMRYQVRGVPALLVLSSDGTVREHIRGYVPPTELRRSLERALNPQFLRKQDSSYLDLLGLLQQDDFPAERWADVMIHMGNKDRRQELHDRILARSAIPRERLVELLKDPRLVVRVGALEVLEELAGTLSNFDPWLDDATAAANLTALDQWLSWARQTTTNTIHSLHTPLSREQIHAHIQDMISGSRDRSIRALTTLRGAGPGAAEVIEEYLARTPDLPLGTRQRIKEVQYQLLIPAIQGTDASVLAHRLVFGTLDMRLQTLTTLRTAGRRAVRIVREFLQDPDAIVRETAVDVLLAGGGRSVVPLLKTHIQTEKDNNVIHRVLRGLGEVRSRRGLELLQSYLSHSDEDMVITALASISKLRSQLAANEIMKCIDDPRWRVRVAAIDAAATLKLTALKSRIIARLEDTDEFVRFSAVHALAALESKEAAGKLEQAFLKEDSLKGPVVQAFSAMKLRLPDRFARELKLAGPDVLISVIEAYARGGNEDYSLLNSLADHENADVACSAIRKLAQSAMDDHAQRLKIIRVLRSEKKERVTAALENLYIQIENGRPPPEIIARWRVAAGGAPPAAGSNEEPALQAPAPGPLKDIMDAFLDAPLAGPTTSTPPAAVAGDHTPGSPGVDEIFSAFLGDAPAPGTPAVNGSDPADSISLLLAELVKFLSPGTDERMRFAATLNLTRFACPQAIEIAASNLNSRTVAERVQIATALESVKTPRALEIFKIMFRDSAPDVRKAALDGCIANARNEAFVSAVFDEVSQQNSLLTPLDLFNTISQRYSYAFAKEKAAKRAAGKWARRALETAKDDRILALALFILETNWSPADEPTVRKLATSENPYVRRAALTAWGKNARESFDKELAQIRNDPSELVRAVIPRVYSIGYSSWVRYLDKDQSARSHDSDSYYSRSGKTPKMPDATKQIIHDLTSDSSPTVRIGAFLCLMSRNETFDISLLLETLDSIPDQAFVLEHITRFVMDNYERLGPSFSLLLPYLRTERWDDERTEKVLAHFNMGGDAELPDLTYVTATGGTRTVQATFLDASPPPSATATNVGTLKLVYFHTPGCPGCQKVETILSQLPELFPGLVIERHNVREVASMRYNEALCERFGVPDNLRLVSPALFTATGWLIKNDITESRISERLAQAAWESRPDWDVVPSEKLAAADQAIGRRYEAMGFAVVTSAGLLDGLNPCAFATIIFFISYLHVARRKPRQILAVGFAFVVGVFLAYFGLGLGLAKVVSSLSFLRGFTRALNWTLGVVTLILMLLNFRDGILCLRGRMQDMSLQLPGFLKSRIHGAIRQGTRQAHFVVAAFLIGVIISCLELACTGQVYAPTIIFMLQTGRHITGALSHLLVYNLAFVTPLIVIFLLAYGGMTSDALVRFLQRRAALVKFATATLFLVLFLFFIFAPDLQAFFLRKVGGLNG